jgi:hypothetical protein
LGIENVLVYFAEKSCRNYLTAGSVEWLIPWSVAFSDADSHSVS